MVFGASVFGASVAGPVVEVSLLVASGVGGSVLPSGTTTGLDNMTQNVSKLSTTVYLRE